MVRWVTVQLHGLRLCAKSLQSGVSAWTWCALGITLCVGLFSACSPSLNWRTVPAGRFTLLLPCKPDHAQRTVVLANQTMAMDMVGCEAAGAMFAVSHVRAPNAQALDATLASWQVAALQQMGAGQSQSSSAQTSGPHPLPMLLASAQGQDGSGQTLQARLAWVRDGLDLYHWALYAPKIQEDMANPFFNEIQAP